MEWMGYESLTVPRSINISISGKQNIHTRQKVLISQSILFNAPTPRHVSPLPKLIINYHAAQSHYLLPFSVTPDPLATLRINSCMILTILAVSIYLVIPAFKGWLCLPSAPYILPPSLIGVLTAQVLNLSGVERMDSNGEHSFWPYGPSVWHDSYLLEEEALLCSLPFPSYGCQPLCSIGPAVAGGSSLQAPCLVPCDAGELDTSFDDDLLRCWEAMEQSGNSTEESGQGLPLLCSGEENGAASNAMRAGPVRSERVLTFELVSQCFYMPITQAARELNVGLTVLKKRCRELGIPRWPHRKLKSLQTLINDVEVLQEAGKVSGDGQLRAMMEMLEQERRLLEQKPYVELEEKTKRLRQACFKASYKKRRLLALEPGEASKYY